MELVVTVVVPKTKVLPELGTDTIELTLQLSLAVGVKVTTAEQLLLSLLTLILAGQVTNGFWLSLTVTVKVHDVEVLP